MILGKRVEEGKGRIIVGNWYLVLLGIFRELCRMCLRIVFLNDKRLRYIFIEFYVLLVEDCI